ncbi:MAG: hypothetical protein K0R72_160 [Clostridia bacterium]|nr:hypothetical protein [Clostridia bacterium]
MKNNDTWYALDNAAKVFPSTSNKKDSKVFRCVCSLTEDIEKDILQKALDKTIKSYPIFSSVLKNGLFWCYLETSSIVPIVKEENESVCYSINKYSNKNLLFNVTYFKKRINLEVYHALADGVGASQFLMSLVLNYLTLKYDLGNDIKLDDISSLQEKEDDSFKKYYKREKSQIFKKEDKAYKIKSFKFSENRIKVIEGVTSTDDLLKLSHEYNTTLTVFLTSILLKSIDETMRMKDKKRPVSITIPINLRKYFKSSTIRNFFVTMNVKYKFEKESTQLKTIIEDTNKQFKENLTKESLSEKFNSYVMIENNLLIRVIPLFLKNILLKIIYNIEMKKCTTSLSNIGIINMPKEVQKYIEMFSFFSGTEEIQVCVCSYNDKTTIGFTSRYINSEIEKNFFRNLSYMGIDIVVNTNQTDEVDEL